MNRPTAALSVLALTAAGMFATATPAAASAKYTLKVCVSASSARNLLIDVNGATDGHTTFHTVTPGSCYTKTSDYHDPYFWVPSGCDLHLWNWSHNRWYPTYGGSGWWEHDGSIWDSSHDQATVLC